MNLQIRLAELNTEAHERNDSTGVRVFFEEASVDLERNIEEIEISGSGWAGEVWEDLEPGDYSPKLECIACGTHYFSTYFCPECGRE
jgi:hypothetical protein